MANPALVAYAKENLAKGCSPDAIRQELLKAGWAEKAVEDALTETGGFPKKEPAQPEAKKTVSPNKVAGLALIFCAMALGIYSAYYLLTIPPAGGYWVENDTQGPTAVTVEPVLPSATLSLPSVVVETPSPTPTATVAVSVVPSPTAEQKPPLILQLSNHSITSDSIVISWITDVPSTTRVLYGTTSLDKSVEYKDLTASHYAKITGLIPNATYTYSVSSCTGSECRYSETQSFTTRSIQFDVDWLELSPSNPTVYVNSSVQLNATIVFKNGTRVNAPAQIIAWNSSNPLVGAIYAGGFFQPAAPGTATINASIANASGINASIQGIWNSTIITVLKAQPRLLISITPSNFVEYGTPTAAECDTSTKQITPLFSRNGGVLSGLYELATLPAGSQSYSCYVNETTNYTSAATAATVIVRKTPAAPLLLINGSAWTADATWSFSKGFYYANFSYSAATTVSTSSECSFNVFCAIFTTGTFAFTASNAGDENHTANSIIRYLSIVS